MAYTTIDDPSAYFQNKAYTGGSGDTAHTFDGNSDMQPDLVWIKNRTQTDNHALIDSVRGSRKWIGSNVTDQEDSNNSAYLASFNSDGFTTSDTDVVGKNGETYASWCWKAGGSASSNSDGSITSTVSANTTSGFSIVKWTGNGSNPSTVGHGLGSVPKMIITKRISGDTASWHSYHVGGGNAHDYYLNGTQGKVSDTSWNSTTPTSSVFTVNGANVNVSGAPYIAYCFADVKGFSSMGSYTGNGNADGTFIYTGFKPAFFLCKRSSDSGYDWLMYDNKRQVSFNVIDDFLKPNSADAETTGNANQSLDFLSNGVKHRGNGASSNGSGATYIYMAFAEAPFVTSTGIPCTAR